MSTTLTLPPWLARLPNEDGFVYISDARRFAHDEANYDAQYRNESGNLSVGQGLLKFVEEASGDVSGPALELGCGTGLLSTGLIGGSPYPLTILSDPSPAFLRITRAKVRAAALPEDRVCYAVLKGEELDRLPPSSLSLIALRSTLHHVLDVDAFIRSASRTLRPGGVLAFQEPCTEGCLLMGGMIQFLPALAAAGKERLTDGQRALVDAFANAMAFYCRRDVDKTDAEDKHLFRVDEIMATGRTYDLEVRFHSNISFEYSVLTPVPPPRVYSRSFRSYAKYCMSWDDGLLALFDRYIAPYCELIDTASGGGSGPHFDGVFICRKTG